MAFASRNPIEGAINIPLAYLERYSSELEKKAVHIVAADSLEKNLGIRLLRRKGFNVTSYTLTECSCRKGYAGLDRTK